MRILGLIFVSATLVGCATTTSADGDLFRDMFAPVPAERLQTAMAAASAHPLGTEENPVRANMPEGQRAYLARLRCSNGSAPEFFRAGSVGEGPYGKIMDLYELRCAAGEPATASVYIDMYHDHVEDRPVPGFSIAAR